MRIEPSLFRQRTDPSTLGERAWVRLLPLEGGDFASVPRPLPPPIVESEPLRQTARMADTALGRLSRLAWSYGVPEPILRPAFLRLFRERHDPSGLWTPYVEDQGNAREPDPRIDESYETALEIGIEELGRRSFCRELPLLLHSVLLPRRDRAGAGRFRTIQTWWQSGGEPRARSPYIPPPPDWIDPSLDALERFVHAVPTCSLTTLAALFYLQFVAIQPFEDGNRRTAGILTSLFWVKTRVLPYPLLDLSGYFRWTSLDWIYRFLRVIRHGAWEEWVGYFLEGIVLECHRASLLLERSGVAG